MVLLFFVPRLLLHPGHILAGIDVQEHSYWDARYIKERLSSLSLPLWNPHSYAGHPFLANFGVHVVYPSTLLTVALPLPWAFAADTLLHTFAAGVDMFLLVRRLSGSAIGGLGAAVIYAFSGHAVDRIYAGHLNILHSVTWLPWITFALEEALRTRRVQWSVICGLLLALAFLGGQPQAPYDFCLVLPLYCLSRSLGGRTLAPVWALSLAVAVALLVSSVQILPSMEFASLSDRAAADFKFATFMSFPPANLGTFIVPHLDSSLVAANWEFTCYPSGLTLIAIAAWWLRGRRRR